MVQVIWGACQAVKASDRMQSRPRKGEGWPQATEAQGAKSPQGVARAAAPKAHMRPVKSFRALAESPFLFFCLWGLGEPQLGPLRAVAAFFCLLASTLAACLSAVLVLPDQSLSACPLSKLSEALQGGAANLARAG